MKQILSFNCFFVVHEMFLPNCKEIRQFHKIVLVSFLISARQSERQWYKWQQLPNILLSLFGKLNSMLLLNFYLFFVLFIKKPGLATI